MKHLISNFLCMKLNKLQREAEYSLNFGQSIEIWNLKKKKKLQQKCIFFNLYIFPKWQIKYNPQISTSLNVFTKKFMLPSYSVSNL